MSVTFSFSTVNHSPRFGARTHLPDIITAASEAGFGHVGLDIWSVRRFVDEGGSLRGRGSRVDDAGFAVTDVLPLVMRTRTRQ